MKYPCKIIPMEVEGHKFFVAKSLYLNGCVGQGETIDDALLELADNETEWLESAEEYNMEIPVITYEAPRVYGKSFPLRMPSSMREEIAQAAEEEGESQNQFIIDAIRTKLVLHNTEKIVAERMTQIANAVMGSSISKMAKLGVYDFSGGKTWNNLLA